MKIQSATHTEVPNRAPALSRFPFPRLENLPLICGVLCAFAFVTTCVFTLG